jgi:predicted extracellular nuclease
VPINRAIELYNGTSAAIDLGDYQVFLYNNGSYLRDGGSFQRLTFTATGGVVAPGDTYVICQMSLDAGSFDPCDLRSNNNAVNFNGNDTLLLRHADGTLVDSLGDGTNPSNDGGSVGWWGSGGNTTQLHDLRRKCGITQGRLDVTTPFDPADQWDAFAPSDLGDLGRARSGCP